MNKTLKKIIALALVFVLAVPVFGAAFSVFAEDEVVADAPVIVEDDAGDEEEVHKTMAELFYEFLKSIWSYIKYIFHDVWIGMPAPDIPEPPADVA